MTVDALESSGSLAAEAPGPRDVAGASLWPQQAQHPWQQTQQAQLQALLQRPLRRASCSPLPRYAGCARWKLPQLVSMQVHSVRRVCPSATARVSFKQHGSGKL